MIHSMTGFARVERQTEVGSLVLELRSVNHRYLDLAFRLPEELRGFEPALRERLQKTLARGKIECHLRYTPGGGAHEIRVDEKAVLALLAVVRKTEELMNNAARLSALEVLQWPGVIQEPALDETRLGEALLEILDAGLQRLVAMRREEGQRLCEMLVQRLAAIDGIVTQLRERQGEAVTAIRDKLRSRLRQLDVEADPGRLEQEIALIAQKLDVDEELDRLDSHVRAATEVLQRREPVGRRLDFLMQEFNREANTLGSKAADAETTAAAVELKVLIEQMREQVQNIE